MRTRRSRQRSQSCWDLAALDDHTLRDIGLTRFDARIRTRRRLSRWPAIRIGLGAGMLLSAALACVRLLAA